MKNKTGFKIRQVRQDLGLSMEEFGKLFNPPASKGVVSNWENGYNKPNNERLKRLSEISKKPIEYFINSTFQFIDEETALSIFKKAYYDCLQNKDGSISENEMRQLKYFNNEKLNDLILEAKNSYFESPFVALPDNLISLENKNYIKTWIVKFFSNLYRKTVITNQTLIDNTLFNMPNLLDILDYGKDGTIISLSNIDLTPLESDSEAYKEVKRLADSDFYISSEIHETAIDDALINEIIKIITDTNEEIKKLKQKYPDNESKIVQCFELYSTEDREKRVWKKNEEEEIDDLKLSDTAKNFLINIISDEVRSIRSIKINRK